MKILLATLLLMNTALAEESTEIECLRKQILELQDRVAQLETATSLLMAGYQSDRKIKELNLERTIVPKLKAEN